MFGINSNIDQLIEKFKGVSQRAGTIDVSQALITGVNAARGEMSFRIFNEGKDAEEKTLGKYSGKKKSFAPKVKLSEGFKKKLANTRLIDATNRSGENFDFSEYEIIRLRAGRQIVYKDLEFDGSLRRGIVVIRETENRVVCAIPNAKLFKIAQGQEQQIGKIRGSGEKAVIFALSKSEKETLRENTNEALKQLYVRILNA